MGKVCLEAGVTETSTFATTVYLPLQMDYVHNMAFKIETQPATAQSQILADFLIAESRERGDLLTPLKLQKLMFYADAWSMALYGEELTSERFQAWVHGPVAVSQYHRFKDLRWRPILDDIEKPKVGKRVKKHLKEIVDIFGVETGPALEIMTHNERPWIEARRGIPEDQACNNYIDKEVTRRFYASLAETEKK